jgi:3-oxoacyl-[acyl-carrier-protein] synthase II
VAVSRIFVHGQGAVSPAGWGVPALWASLENERPLQVQSLVRPGWDKPLPVRLVPPPAVRPAFLAHPRLRRASPMTHFAVGAALEALGQDAGLIRSGGLRLGILTCTLTGGISYSRRFYEETLQNPATASPMIFPETVFNSSASHLAAFLGSSTINYTLVGDAGTFLQGLAVAAGWLGNGLVEACVVIGAEEPDWTAADALRLFDSRAVHASGAGALYLKSRCPSHAPVELAAVTDSFAATRTPGRNEAARKMRAQLPVGVPDELLCASERHSPAWNDWTGKVLTPVEILGEAFAAASAWQCVAACVAIQHSRCPAANVSITGASLQAVAARFVNPHLFKTPEDLSP